MSDYPWKDNRGTPEYNNAYGYVTSKIERRYTKNGKDLYHHTWFNTLTNCRISYDTYDAGIGVGHVYVDGSGHEVNQRTNEVINRWDGNARYVRYDLYGNVADIVFSG